MDAKISKYTEKLLNSEIMAVKTRRQEHKKALDEAKKELSKYDDTSKAEKGQGEYFFRGGSGYVTVLIVRGLSRAQYLSLICLIQP